MISKNAKKFCKDPIEWIENYQEAVNDQENIWVCHHKKEIELDMSRVDLIKNDLYFDQPAEELIFLTKSEHSSIHGKQRNFGQFQIGHEPWNKGKHHTEETKQKMREAKLGSYPTEETKQKRSNAMKAKNYRGENNPQYKKICPLLLWKYKYIDKLPYWKMTQLFGVCAETIRKRLIKYQSFFTC